MMDSIEEILKTHDERIRKATPTEMFNAAYASINMAQELVCKMADVNVGNIPRSDILKLDRLALEAACAVRGLDNWRKANPHPDDPGV